MRRFLLPTVSAAVMSLLFLGITGNESVRSATPPATAVSSFQGCVRGATQAADVLIVMDQTQSLRTTDPTNLRIVGLKATLRSMASEHETNPNVTYRVRMVGFGRTVVSASGAGLSDWLQVTPSSLTQLYESANIFSRPANGDIGTVTNFNSALQYADSVLSASQAPCRAVLWFTDGALDVSNNGSLFPTTSQERHAMSEICRPGGIAGSLAHDGIWNFVVGLTNFTGSRGGDALASIARGGRNYLYSGECGQSNFGVSTSTATGAYFDSPNTASLIFQMQGLVCTGSNCESQVLQPCVKSQECPENHQFKYWVGPGIASFTFDGLVSGMGDRGSAPEFQLTDTTTEESIIVSMRGGDTTCSLPSGSLTPCIFDGIRLTATSLSRNEIRVVGRLARTVTSGHSLRGVYLVPSGVSGPVHYTFFLKSSFDLAFTPQGAGTPECPRANGASVYIGCESRGTILLVDSITKAPIAERLASLRDITSSLQSNSDDVVPVLLERSNGPVLPYSLTVPGTATIGIRYLQASGLMDLVENGVVKASVDVSLRQVVQLVPAPGFPVVVVSPSSPQINVGDSFSIPVKVTGAARGNGGCVSLASSRPQVVGGTNLKFVHLKTTIPRTCRPIGLGQSITYFVQGQLAEGKNGPFAIRFDLRIGSADDKPSFEAPKVSIDLRANVPVNVGGSVLLLGLFLLLAVLGILLMSLLVNSLTGRFPARNTILARSVPVELTASGIRSPGKGTLEFDGMLSNEAMTTDAKRSRNFPYHGLRFEASTLRRPLTWLTGLFRGPQATVTAGDAKLIVGGVSTSASSPRKGPIPVSQQIAGTWIIKVGVAAIQENGLTGGSAESVVTGELTVFVELVNAVNEVQGILGKVREEAPRFARDLLENPVTVVVAVPSVQSTGSASDMFPI